MLRAGRLVMKRALLLALCVAACGRDPIDVYDSKEADAFDFGRSELLAAVAEAAQDRESPEAIAKLAATIDDIRSVFNRSVEEEAERQLVFLSIGPLAANFTRPIEEQLETLGLTVWPIALRVEPEEGETPRQYAARVCEGALALECKHAVPEFWPVLLSSVVWRRMKERAREAYVRCGPCQAEPEKTYDAALELYRAHQTRIGAEAAIAKKRAHPRNWPRAGENASPWPEGTPLLEFLDDGSVEFRGVDVDEAWRQTIREKRDGADVLGVHVGPNTDVRRLQSIMKDAQAAGYGRIALQVRAKDFPYQPSAYFIDVGRARGAAKAPYRPIDSIQVLVESLDNRAQPGTVFSL